MTPFLSGWLILTAVCFDPELPKFPRTLPTEPLASLAKFRTLHGFRMELIAAEPLVMDPVAAAYDEDGRLYVVEMSDYPHVDPKNDKPFTENTLDPPIGRLKLLTDRDGDGRFDSATILADKLSWPTGVAIWKGGVFVAATPSIWYFKDADGDGRAEIRENVYEGFRKFNIQAVMNNLQWGLDHAIYGAASGNGGEVRPANEPAAPAIPVLRRDFRFFPATRAFEAISGGARFGNTFDDWGNRFLCDIRNPAEHVVLPARYLARNPRLAAPRVMHDAALAGDTIPMFRISPTEPWREFRAKRWAANGKVLPRSELVGAGYLTSSSGVTVYRGDAYPPEFRGQLFLGEVANNLIHRETLEPNGVTFTARRADTGVEFVASTDTWFRPVNFVNAPDGTLHVLDMYRETIEHPWSIPDDIKAGLDLRSGEDRGRIYRLVPAGFQAKTAPKLSRATIPEIVALLSHPNAWHRDSAHRLLYERQDVASVPLLRALIQNSTNPLARLHALYSLEGLKSLEDDDLLVALGDSAAEVREHAVALSETRLNRSIALKNRIIALAGDRAIRARFQVAFSLGEIAGAERPVIEALAKISERDATDPWVRTAILSSADRVAEQLFETILSEKRGVTTPGIRLVLRELAGFVGAKGDLSAVAHMLERLASGMIAKAESETLEEVLLGLSEGLSRSSRKTLRDVPASTATRVFLDSVLSTAEQRSGDHNSDPAIRERAIALLAQAGFAKSGRVFAELLKPNEPQGIQLAALRSLATFSEPEVAKILIEHWTTFSPSLRTEAITRLLSRSDWIVALLDSVESGRIPAAVIPANRRALLLSDKNSKIQTKARALLGAAKPGTRDAAYSRYRAALDLPTDRERGSRVYERECATCHKVGGRGFAVGPNLASVQRRTPEEVLLHVVDPNREVSPDYLEYAVALVDGRVLSGLIAAESASSLTLRRAGGSEDTVLRSNIEAITGTGKSLMPEGLEERISMPEMADLLRFLLEVQQ